MSQENVEVARRAVETLAEGDFGAWLALHHPLASSHLTSWPPRAASHTGGTKGAGPSGSSGVPIDRRVWQVFKVLDRQATWWRIYPSEAEALEAVGLSE